MSSVCCYSFSLRPKLHWGRRYYYRSYASAQAPELKLPGYCSVKNAILDGGKKFIMLHGCPNFFMIFYPFMQRICKKGNFTKTQYPGNHRDVFL